MFPKPIRIKNPKLLQIIREQPCVICHRSPCDPDHIVTRGAGGDDTPSNLWPLCRSCHTLRHSIGIHRLAQRFPVCLMWLRDHGHDDIVEAVEEMNKLN